MRRLWARAKPCVQGCGQSVWMSRAAWGDSSRAMVCVLPCGQVLWAPGCLWHVALAFHVWPFLRAPAPSPLSAEPLDSLKDLPLSTSIPLATAVFILNPVPPDQNPPGVTLEF